MSDALAIAGTFADFKLVKTRGMAQFVVEVPIDQADKALALLGGVPRADKEVWVAVAPLVPEAAKAATASPKNDAARERGREQYLMADDGERAVTRAALLPKDQAFRDHYGCNDEEAAAKMIRDACGIKSRRELASNERAYTIFRDIEFQFHGHAEVRG